MEGRGGRGKSVGREDGSGIALVGNLGFTSGSKETYIQS